MLHKPWFKKYFSISILFLLGMMSAYFLLSYISATFRVKNVELFGVTQYERTTITKLVTGVSTLFLQNSEISKRLYARYPTLTIRESKVQLPNTLVIVLEKDPPIAYLQTDNGYLSLSKNGEIMSKERAVTIPSPSISFYQIIHHLDYPVGSKVGFNAIERSLTFTALLIDLGYQPETVAIDSVDMIACKTKGFDVIFSQTRPVDLQTHEVRQIIRQIKAGALRIARLDLRFDKPVVQLPKK